MKKSLAAILAIVMVCSFAIPALAADFPHGATNRVINVGDGPRPGNYIVNDGFNEANPYAREKLAITDYHMRPEWETYKFDPANYPGIQMHPDGFPMRAGHRTLVDHMGEMRYLAETYPEIVKMRLIGYSFGIDDDVTATNQADILEKQNPERSIPVYALEICNEPGVMDGRPATLHQAANHGGEIEACELAMNLAWYLTSQYGKVDEVTNLLDTTRIYILPYTNPDGSICLFRAGGTSTIGRQTPRAVDPNRNWAYRWGSKNGSGDGLGGRGRGPNSENETVNVSSIYRSDNIISSISGHTNGQIIIYAWAYMYNSEDAHPLLTKLAAEQSALNGHTPQNGNVMYAQSGEINDYLWGSMRAMGFTYEYGQIRPLPYLGTPTGEDYITANYLDAAGNQKTMRANYSTAAGSGKPATEVEASLVWMPDEYISIGYQQIDADDMGNGINKDPDDPDAVGSWHRRITPAKVEAWIASQPAGFLNGKIFVSHRPILANDYSDDDVTDNVSQGNAIAAMLKNAGAAGWLVSNTAATGGAYSPITNMAYGAEGLPVVSMTKGYIADVFNHAKEDPATKITLKADTDDFLSMYYEWERQKPAYMANMSYARTYANQLQGTITDGNGNKLFKATLEATLVIEGKIVDIDSSFQNSPVLIERDYEKQWKEVQRTHYDVEGGDYTWYMLPSKQSEYPDKGWTVTAKAPGRYTETQNVRFPLDYAGAIRRGQDATTYADPTYQNIKTGVDFDLPLAFVVDQDLDALMGVGPYTVTFTTYNRAGAVANQAGVTVKVNGRSVEVANPEVGKYSATFNNAENISISFAGAEAVTFGFVEDEGVPFVKTFDTADLELTTDANLLNAGDVFGLRTAFVKKVDTNVVRLTYTYNPALFEFVKDTTIANFTEAGYSVINVDENAEGGQVEFTLMKQDGSYGMKEFYPFTTKQVEHTALQNYTEFYSNDPTHYKYSEYYIGDRTVGDTVIFTYLDEAFTDATFKAKEDIDFEDGHQTITVVADYIDRSDDTKVEKQSHIAMVTFTTKEPVVFDLIYLSNIIDAFGLDTSHPEWDTKYVWMDWVKNGRIDIADIAYAARQIV